MNEEEKVEICHNGRTLEVATSALKAHYGHGDTLGPCEEIDIEDLIVDSVDSKEIIPLDVKSTDAEEPNRKSALERLKNKINGKNSKE